MEEVTDKLETLILMALDANHSDATPSIIRRDKFRGGTEELHDQGELLRISEMRPSSAYTFDMTDSDRIFSRSKDYLITHPADVIGEEAEIMMLSDGVFKWRGFRKLKQAPRGVCCLGRASHWYEMHIRFVTCSGAGEYHKRVVALNSTGDPLLTKIQGHVVGSPRLEGEMFVLCASVIEDAHRTNTMLAAVKDATEIKFPVPIDDYKDVFADREGPMNGARRKAIVHWVARHLRRSINRNEHEVKRHTRGIQEFAIDGLRVRLTPNDLKAHNVGDNPPQPGR